MIKINRAIVQAIVLLIPLATASQNKHNIKADIERAVKEFFYKVSEMNNPIEPIRPEDFASAYQKGVNVFQINSGDIKMINFLAWYKKNVLKDYSISHHIRIIEIKKLPESGRYTVIGVLERKIEDDTQRRRVEDEPIELKVIWRGQEYNNVSIQSIAFNLELTFIKPDVIKEYELSLDQTLSYIPAEGGKWDFTIISNVKSMEGFNGEERTCIATNPIGTLYSNIDDIDIHVSGSTLSGYIKPNKSKTSKGYLIIIEQKESKKIVGHCIYQAGKKKKSKK